MDFGSLFFVMGLALVVGIYLLRPFIERQAEGISIAEREMSALWAQKEGVLSTLADLDMDMEQGKMLQSHYLTQRRELLMQGADVLRQIEALTEAYPELGSTPIDDEIEAAVAGLRGGVDAGIQSCRACGGAIAPGDRFCAKCGNDLNEAGDR